mgnify:CR=1 FL=1
MSRVLLGPAASAVTQSPWGDLGPAAPIPAAPIPTLARLRRLLALPKSRGTHISCFLLSIYCSLEL